MPLPIRSRPLDRPSPLPTRSIAAQPARRREIPRAPQVLVPLHYEPDYRYPLIVWVDDDPTAGTLPQQSGIPSPVITQSALAKPVEKRASVVSDGSPTTSTGADDETLRPSPSCPLVPVPQQLTRFPLRIAQQKRSIHATSRASAMPTTSTG